MIIAYLITLVICFAVTLIVTSQRQSQPHYKWFAALMAVTLLTELGSYFEIFPLINQSNHWTFNLQTVIEFYFFSYFFYNIGQGLLIRRIVRVFVIAYPIILLISFLTVQKYYIFHTYTYILALLYLCVLCLLYYRELYTAGDFKKLSTLPEFWIVTGLLIFSAGVLPYLIMLNYLNEHYDGVSIYFREYLLSTLNIIMYLMFTTGLLWKVRYQK